MNNKINQISNIEFKKIIDEIRNDINNSRYNIIKNANKELLNIYFKIGKILEDNKKYGSSFIDELSHELKLDYPKMKGFSSRNLWRMQKFYNEYKDYEKLPMALAELTWSNNYTLIERIKNIDVRMWYAKEAVKNGWSNVVLNTQIDTDLYQRQKINPKLVNFDGKISKEQSDSVRELMKDPYIFELSNVDGQINERKIEDAMIERIKDVLLELGKGFSFVGSEYKVSTPDNDYYIDLLFYHINLKCYIVVELKNTDFKPDYVGQINFYVTAVDKTLKTKDDNPTLGLLLCRNKDRVSVEWALERVDSPIGVSSYKIQSKLTEQIKDELPSEEELEKEINLHLNLDDKNNK